MPTRSGTDNDVDPQLATYRTVARYAQIRELLRTYARDIARLEEPEDDDITMFHLCVDLLEFAKSAGIDGRENFKEAWVHVHPRTTEATR